MNPNASSGTPKNSGQSASQPASSPAGEQPVAYDNQGRPLYLHPPAPGQQQPQMVYMARPIDPQDVPVSPEVQARHEESRKKYPSLNLSNGEYVISAVRRHPIGVLRIWLTAALLIVVFAAVSFFIYNGEQGDSAVLGSVSDLPGVLLGILGVLYVLILLGAFLATYVYQNNRFYLTNESVVQEIQSGLFDKHEQTVSLSNIEDASYKQTSFIQTLLGYGTIRLSTEGDETTYTFAYVTDPKRHIAKLNNAVEAFKLGRPVDPNEWD